MRNGRYAQIQSVSHKTPVNYKVDEEYSTMRKTDGAGRAPLNRLAKANIGSNGQTEVTRALRAAVRRIQQLFCDVPGKGESPSLGIWKHPLNTLQNNV